MAGLEGLAVLAGLAGIGKDWQALKDWQGLAGIGEYWQGLAILDGMTRIGRIEMIGRIGKD